MTAPITNAGLLLISLFFSLAAFLLWARIGLRLIRVNPFHPLNQAIYRLTNPIIMPLSKLFPQALLNVRFDLVCFSLLFVLGLLKFLTIGVLSFSTLLPFSWLAVYSIADLIIQPCNILFYIILIRVVMSWVNPVWNHPIAEILRQLSEPLLKVGRRIMPDISGFDFSPFFVLVILKIIPACIQVSLPLQLF